ncbi:Glucose-6-phosphate/phosphate translocator [Babesia sp. Xinjiang]|uniref:Glucose-6-phosphate/phosphate translocator n=1 Tax=Babesia sp. Xinjiang TaxID=462227 RepID=UPI000A24317F|nr:Glucose-6-phosphate/phosphate translocator [Babesia sp. Xinjiang]ORM41250.1 Glucose-6-phosphate/phosphate translocator [Babesia sp. Xinjiang]
MEVTQRNKEVPELVFTSAQDAEYDHALPASAFPEKCASTSFKDRFLALDWWLIFYFVLWYGQNALYVVFNKLFLNAVPLPWTISAFQLLVGWIFMFLYWGCNIRERPHFDSWFKFCKTFLPLSFLHFFVHVGSVISMGLGAISFTHVVKALEPVITAVLSIIFLREFLNAYAYLCLIPIVAGVSLASLKELDFNWAAFLFAMLSNVTGALRSILAKVTMKNKAEIGEHLTPNNIYMILTLIASFVSLTFVLGFESLHWVSIWNTATKELATKEKILVIVYGVASGIFYFMSNDSAFYCLGQINQVTYSVANTAKRVLLIMISIVVFGTKVSPMGSVGMVTAVLGTFLYSVVK